MQTTATRQGSKQATDADVPVETTRASTTFGFTRPLLQRSSGNRFRGVARYSQCLQES
jgi:hypothetical protein